MKTVLLIEDNHDLRDNTVEMLELAGYKTLVALNGILGLALAKEKLPDVILCDIMMPEMNGYEVFRQLRTNEPTSTIPFIFFTASAEKSEIKAGLEMGAYDYISKPFEEYQLIDSIERCLIEK